MPTCVILAGGEGKRLGSLTARTPKPMICIRGRPILEWQILQLRRAGIEEITLLVNFRAEVIESYFGTGARWDVSLQYVADPEHHRGTAHLLQTAVRNLAGGHTEVIVLAGDVLADLDVTHLLAYHRRQGRDVTVVGERRQLPLGILEIDQQSTITAVHEKPTVFVAAAFMVMNRAVIESMSPEGDFFKNIEDAIAYSGCAYEGCGMQLLHVSEVRDDVAMANAMWQPRFV